MSKVHISVINGDIKTEDAGILIRKEDCDEISYGTNRIILYDDRMLLREDGEVKTEILFMADATEKPVSYDTGFGSLELSVTTHNFSVTRSDKSITVEIDYELEVRMHLLILITSAE